MQFATEAESLASVTNCCSKSKIFALKLQSIEKFFLYLHQITTQLMYLLYRNKDRKKEENYNFYHGIIVPSLFVALWVAGLAFSIQNPQLPFLNSNNNETATNLLSSLVYIYIIFIVEVFVTFTDIHNVYRLYNAKKLLLRISMETILPNVILTILAFIWYYNSKEEICLLPVVILSACIKFEEVWLANNGEKVFTRQQEKMDKDKVFRPQQLS